jgi:mannose PTS system EIIA component
VLGVVIVSYGNLAHSYLEVAEEMIGKQQYISCVSYFMRDDMETTREEIMKAIKTVDTGRGVIVIADMFGGVPCNLAISVAQGQNVDVLSGMNLTMLLKLLTVRDILSAKEAIHEAKQIGTKYITVLSDLLQELGE